MAKFDVEVVITKQIEVTVGEGVLTPEFIAAFKKDFYDLDTEEEHIAFIAKSYARGFVKNDGFLEGYGYIKVDGDYRESEKERAWSYSLDINVREWDEDVDTSL